MTYDIHYRIGSQIFIVKTDISELREVISGLVKENYLVTKVIPTGEKECLR